MALNSFATSNMGFKAKSPYSTTTPGKNVLPPNQVNNQPTPSGSKNTQSGLAGNSAFTSPMNFKTPMQGNLGINGQPQTGNISFGQTYKNIVGGALGLGARALDPSGGLLVSAFNGLRNSSKNGAQAPAPAPKANAAANPQGGSQQQGGDQYTPPWAQNGPGSGGATWTPKTDQYGNQLNPDGSSPSNTGGNTGGSAPGQNGGYSVNPGLYGQLITGLANRANQPNPQFTDAYNRYQDLNSQISGLAQNHAQQTANIEGSPIDLSLATGQEGILNRLYAAKQGALSSQLQGVTNVLGATNTQQGLQQSGLQGAAGLAAPQFPSYNQQLFNPATGQFGNGSGGGSLNEAVQNVVQRLQNGTMTYNDALNALSGYGQGGVNALQGSLPQGFNIAQSNTLSGQQGSIGPALQYANVALQNLSKSFSNLQVPGQQSNISALGSGAGLLSSITGYGKQQTTEKEGALAEARQAIQSVLASVKGGTPTDYTAQSHSILPDNATPADVNAAVNLLGTLGQAKQSIYGNSGNSSSGGSSSGGTWSW